VREGGRAPCVHSSLVVSRREMRETKNRWLRCELDGRRGRKEEDIASRTARYWKERKGEPSGALIDLQSNVQIHSRTPQGGRGKKKKGAGEMAARVVLKRRRRKKKRGVTLPYHLPSHRKRRQGCRKQNLYRETVKGEGREKKKAFGSCYSFGRRGGGGRVITVVR